MLSSPIACIQYTIIKLWWYEFETAQHARVNQPCCDAKGVTVAAETIKSLINYILYISSSTELYIWTRKHLNVQENYPFPVIKDTPVRFSSSMRVSVCTWSIWDFIIEVILKPNYNQIFQWLKFCFKAKKFKWRVNICLFKWFVRLLSLFLRQCSHTPDIIERFDGENFVWKAEINIFFSSYYFDIILFLLCV